jgi:hypothetical protein
VKTFTTETGSVYELDSDQKRIRRLSGIKDPTVRQGLDGDWKDFASLMPPDPVEGGRVYIIWKVDNVDGVSVNRGTLTSAVVKVEEVQ